MAERTPLTKEEVEEALKDLDNWFYDGDRLVKEFTFGSFREAISFIVRMSYEAEQRDHHPELTNVYNRVSIALNTHDAEHMVTEIDIELARAIDKFSWS